MARRAVNHFMPWCPQDYRSSRIRMQSVMDGDPLLRLLYTEILNALWEQGGEISADPKKLRDLVALPAKEIEARLPSLMADGEGDRGGLIISGGRLTNLRVTEDLAAIKARNDAQVERGKLSATARKNRTGSAAPTVRGPGRPKKHREPPLAIAANTGSQSSEPPLNQRSTTVRDNANLPYPFPYPLPIPIPKALETPALVQGLAKWMKNRKATKGKDLTEYGLGLIFKDIEKYGEAVVLLAWDEAIKNGWTGYFPDRIASQKGLFQGQDLQIRNSGPAEVQVTRLQRGERSPDGSMVSDGDHLVPVAEWEATH